MTKSRLTKEEKQFLKDFEEQTRMMENMQVMDLDQNCDHPSIYAKTHSTYIKSWEQTKQQMEEKLENGELPPDTSAAVIEEMIKIGDKIINEKLEKVQRNFSRKFGESIFNYLGSDGKAKSCLPIVLLVIVLSATGYIIQLI